MKTWEKPWAWSPDSQPSCGALRRKNQFIRSVCLDRKLLPKRVCRQRRSSSKHTSPYTRLTCVKRGFFYLPRTKNPPARRHLELLLCYNFGMKEEFAKKFFIPILAVAVLSFIPFLKVSQKDTAVSQGQMEKTIPISIGQVTVKAFIADTGPLRQRGLGGREGILSDEAMLFVFDRPARHGIWMKDMRFPIDIFWLQETQINADKDTLINADERTNLVIVEMKERVLPSSYPEVFTPISPAKYVLETHAGFTEKNQVKIGDEVSF